MVLRYKIQTQQYPPYYRSYQTNPPLVSQSDISPYLHVIGVGGDSDADQVEIQIKQKVYEFCNSTFDSRCPATQCQKRIQGKIHVVPGKYTIVSINRNSTNRSKIMSKLDLSHYNA